MMNMTQVRDAVKVALNRQDEWLNPYLIATSYSGADYINRGVQKIMEVTAALDPKFYFAQHIKTTTVGLTTGSAAYDYRAAFGILDLREFVTLRINPTTEANALLEYIRPEIFDQMYPYASYAEGQPCHYTQETEFDIRFGPTPDEDYVLKIKYIKHPDLMISATQFHEFPTDVMMVNAVCCEVCYFLTNEPEKGKMFENQLVQNIRSVMQMDKNRDEIPRVPRQPYLNHVAGARIPFTMGEPWNNPFVEKI